MNARIAIRFVLLGLIVLLLQGCQPLKPAYEVETNPDLYFVKKQIHDMYALIDDASVSQDDKQTLLLQKFEAGLSRLKATPYYGHYFDGKAFEEVCGNLFQGVINYYDGVNNPAAAIVYAQRAAEEARRASLYGHYLSYSSQAFDRYLLIGNFDRAGYVLDQMQSEINRFLSVDLSRNPSEQDVYTLYYHQYITDLRMALAQAQGNWPPLADLKSAHQFRKAAQRAYPALQFMQPTTSAKTVESLNQQGNKQSRADSTTLRLYAFAFAASGDTRDALEVLEELQRAHRAAINAIEQDARSAELRLLRVITTSSGAIVPSRAQIEQRKNDARRNGTRSKVWLHWDAAQVYYNLGDYQHAYDEIVTAQSTFTQVDRLYELLDDTYANVDNIKRDYYSILMLRARSAERLNRLDEAIRLYSEVIEWSELARASMALNARQHFFRSFAKAAYLGRVRAIATQVAQNNDYNPLLMALESFRSRQLKEQLGADSGQVPTLAEIKAKLSDEEAIVVFTDLEQALLTLVIDKNEANILQVSKPEDWDQRIFSLRDRLVRSQRYFPGAYQDISDLVFGKLRSQIASKPRLHVLTDGTLSILPINLLPIAEGEFLQQRHVISYLPSLTFLHAGSGEPAAEGLFAVGDPLYQAGNAQASGEREYLMATRGADILSAFTPLPETRSEVQSIATTLRGKSTLLLGANAAESYIKKTGLDQYRYLHFATHGVLGGEVPDLLEPALVLSDEAGEDGFLTASEVAGLKLNADITVLSACNTGNGEYFRGEGLMGLGRAFLIAGSRHVIVSLWPVDSVATEKLMVAFYQELGRDADAAGALARAQLSLQGGGGMRRGDRGIQLADQAQTFEGYGNPYFWSPFILVSVN